MPEPIDERRLAAAKVRLYEFDVSVLRRAAELIRRRRALAEVEEQRLPLSADAVEALERALRDAGIGVERPRAGLCEIEDLEREASRFEALAREAARVTDQR